MNFLRFDGQVAPGTDSVGLSGQSFGVPRLNEAAKGKLVFGVRPEHIALDDAAPYRARITATEYLGTTQIVTLATPNGTAKARISAAQTARPGETVGLTFNPLTISLFDEQSGRALRSALTTAEAAHG
jgi:multiple sugar transport system ATP-binding protein